MRSIGNSGLRVGADRGRDLLFERLDLRQQRLKRCDQAEHELPASLELHRADARYGRVRSFASSRAGLWPPE